MSVHFVKEQDLIDIGIRNYIITSRPIVPFLHKNGNLDFHSCLTRFLMSVEDLKEEIFKRNCKLLILKPQPDYDDGFKGIKLAARYTFLNDGEYIDNLAILWKEFLRKKNHMSK